MTIHKILKDGNISEIHLKLNEKGYKVALASIYNWMNGVSPAPFKAVQLICDITGTDIREVN